MRMYSLFIFMWLSFSLFSIRFRFVGVCVCCIIAQPHMCSGAGCVGCVRSTTEKDDCSGYFEISYNIYVTLKSQPSGGFANTADDDDIMECGVHKRMIARLRLHFHAFPIIAISFLVPPAHRSSSPNCVRPTPSRRASIARRPRLCWYCCHCWASPIWSFWPDPMRESAATFLS